MPPTMSVTVGKSAALATPAKAIRAARATPVRAVFNLTFFILFPPKAALRRNSAMGYGLFWSYSPCTALTARWRTPCEQFLFDNCHQRFSASCQQANQQHGPEHTIGIEGILRCGDYQTQSILCAQEFTHDGPDNRKAKGNMQASDDPGHRRWNNHMPDNLQPRSTHDAGIGNVVAINPADPLESVEEHHEEHQQRCQHHFRGEAKTQPHHED